MHTISVIGLINRYTISVISIYKYQSTLLVYLFINYGSYMKFELELLDERQPTIVRTGQMAGPAMYV